MSVEHISDDKIQDYLDNRDSKRDISLIRHIRQCDECRAKLHHYRLLYHGLNRAEEVSLPQEFASRTMRAIRALPTPVEKRNWGGFLAGAATVAAMIAATFYFLGTAWIYSSAEAVQQVAWHSHFSVIDLMLQGIRRLQDGATIVAAAAIILIGTALLDKAIGKTKFKRISPLSL
jgi:anti-sigma factor RsiW